MNRSITAPACAIHGRSLAGRWAAFLFLSAAVLSLAGVVCRAQPAAAEASDVRRAYQEHLRQTKGVVDIRLVHDSGSGPNAFNLMVVSAGFRADEAGDFFNVCDTLVRSLFHIGAWQRYQGMINIYGILVDDESPDTTRVSVRGYKGQVLGCENKPAIEFANFAWKSDATVVIHNSTFATATCGPWAMVTGNRDTAGSARTLQHELGHSVGGLGDTYVQRPGRYDGSLGSLWEGKNATDQPVPILSHWHYWTQDRWPGVFGPLKLPDGANVINVEGGAWATGFYRPEDKCVMHGGDSRTYCTICTEVMESCFFRTINMFEEVTPPHGELVLWKGESQTFRLKALKFIREPPPWMHSQLDFYVDGRQVARAGNGEMTFQFGGALATPGIHQLGANLCIQPERVRRDDGFLTTSRAWRVKVMPHEKPRLTLPPSVRVQQGALVKVPVRVDHSRRDLVDIQMRHAPEGAVFRNGVLEWRADRPGAWCVDFTVAVAQQEALTQSVVIQVEGADAGAASLALNAPAPVDALVGKETVIQLAAAAGPDVTLLYQVLDAPEGMQVDRGTGKIVWTPRVEQYGPRRLRYRVGNGAITREGEVLVGVCAESVPYLNSYLTTHTKDRLAWIEQHKDTPLLYEKIFGLSRLFRDRFSAVYTPALAEAKATYAGLPPSMRETFQQDLTRHAWTFVDRPRILEWMEEISKGRDTDSARRLNDTVGGIRLWTKVKEVETEGRQDCRRQLVTLLPKTNEEGVRSAVRRAVKALYEKAEDKTVFHREILEALHGAAGKERAALFGLLPLVDLPSREKILLDAILDANPDVARSAYATLIETATVNEIGPVARRLVTTADPRRRTALTRILNAIFARVDDRSARQSPMLEALDEARGPGRAELVGLLPLVNEPRLIEVLARLRGDADATVAAAADRALRHLQDEIGATDGYVASWSLSGPYLPAEGQDLFRTAFAPETGAPAEWKPYRCPESHGPRVVPLGNIFGGNQRAAYMRAVVRSDKARPVLFGAGSDDGIVVWLNGKVIHSNNVARAVTPDEDRFTGTLQAGENVILCKITQSVLGWGACLSIRAPDGGPALGVSAADTGEVAQNK